MEWNNLLATLHCLQSHCFHTLRVPGRMTSVLFGLLFKHTIFDVWIVFIKYLGQRFLAERTSSIRLKVGAWSADIEYSNNASRHIDGVNVETLHVFGGKTFGLLANRMTSLSRSVSACFRLRPRLCKLPSGQFLFSHLCVSQICSFNKSRKYSCIGTWFFFLKNEPTTDRWELVNTVLG